MFSKFKLKQGAGRVDQNLNLQLINYNYHATNQQLSHANSKWDVYSKDIFIFVNSTNKMENIEKQVNKYMNIKKEISTDNLLLQNILNKSLITFKKAVEHDCYHDIIARNEIDKTVTVAFLPISTSDSTVSCGIQKFNKIFVNINLKGYKKFYITRLLFHKTMPVNEYNKWVIDSKKWYQDPKLRKALFNEIQRDLDNNHYSLLKYSDLINPNAEFLSKELPLVKFKFTELEL